LLISEERFESSTQYWNRRPVVPDGNFKLSQKLRLGESNNMPQVLFQMGKRPSERKVHVILSEGLNMYYALREGLSLLSITLVLVPS